MSRTYTDANGNVWDDGLMKPWEPPITWLGEVPLDPLTDKPIESVPVKPEPPPFPEGYDYVFPDYRKTTSGNAYDQSVKSLKADAVNPVHYTTTDGRQVWDVMEEDYLTPEQYQGYLLGNVAKYLHRYTQKNGLEDVEKAKAYFIRFMKFQKDNA